jgi:L-serine dehydratase
MERISVFDMFKIGIGPSSSHTMGPWKAALKFVQELKDKNLLEEIDIIDVWLYGSLAKTGIGHGTDIAIINGLMGHLPHNVPVEKVLQVVEEVKLSKRLKLSDQKAINFDFNSNIQFLKDQTLPFHSNALTLIASGQQDFSKTYYSLGGGFIVEDQENSKGESSNINMPFPIDNGDDLQRWCLKTGKSIPQIVLENELAIRSEKEISQGINDIWETMKQCVYQSCHKGGVLPGGLDVSRRAGKMSKEMLNGIHYDSVLKWMMGIKENHSSFNTNLKWLICFALAVNEENASFGRVVTAPTNGAAGVIPAVLMFHLLFSEEAKDTDVQDFLFTAGEIGSIFKKGATISAAMGGCQAEIGVSSAMAAAGLTQCLGGNYKQVMMAAEIAMEHHLGLTCDPIGGLVQIPCIERNTMGAIKAITASNIALSSDPENAKVSLDSVVKTMMQTAQDMNLKYKETSEGGLAINISVNIAEC